MTDVDGMGVTSVRASDANPQSQNALPAGARWWLLAVLFLVALVSYSDRTILNVLVDPLRRDLRITDSQVSLLQGLAFTLVYVFASLPLGRLADRRNRRHLLVTGSTTWCAATVLSGMAPDFWSLFGARMLVGVSEAALIPAAVSMIVDAFPARRHGLAIGIFVVATIVGGPAGITIGGLLGTWTEQGNFRALPLIGALAPWRQTLIAAGISGLLGPLLLLGVREPARAARAAGSVRDAGRFALQALWLLLPLYLGMALLAVGDYGMVSWAPTTLSRRFDWSPSQIGLTFGVLVAITGVAGALGGGWLSDLAARRGGSRARLSLCIPSAIAGAGAALLLRTDTPSTVLCGIGLWTCFSSIGALGAVAALQASVPEQFRGSAMAAITFCNTLIGLGCGPALVALVTDRLYATPVAVGHAIGAVVTPAALMAATAFFLARRQLRER